MTPQQKLNSILREMSRRKLEYESIDITYPDKLEKFYTTKKRFKIAYGGRGAAKSNTFAKMLIKKSVKESAKVGCLREFQNSIDDSVYSLISEEIKLLRAPGFDIRKSYIDNKRGGGFRFKGLARSIESVKSAHGFKYFWLEEGQFISKESLKTLTPTLREEDSELWISANPMNSSDPFSQRFIIPFESELERNGIYEDDLHLIVKINYDDNPWFPGSLEMERQYDYETLPRALYDHIWLGAFNDSVENSLIMAEWFDACVDAHKELGFEPVGMKLASHDPSDKGPDSKGFAYRHGSVVLDVQEKINGDITDGCKWATGLAVNHRVDSFTWDCDGMGVGLNGDIERVFRGKHTKLTQFKGSEGVDFPDQIFESTPGIQEQKTNKHAIKNKRAQYYYRLRKLIHNTYLAVVEGKYIDPDELISFDSSIKCLNKLKSELCKMPIKPNGRGLFELYTKAEMKTKFKFNSPNLGDSVMMLTKTPHIGKIDKSYRPMPITVMGRRQHA
jgi:phage terminase large subunit